MKDCSQPKENRATQEFVQLVSPNLPLVCTRLCLIFGNKQRENVHNMALHAASLYYKGTVKKIIVTGGAPFADNLDTVTEAQYARRLLIARGVPPKAILFENKSGNTYENVVNARRLVQKAEGRLRREPIVCLGMNHATSRFLMTLAKTWPEITPTFIGFDRFDRAKTQWHTCDNIVSLLNEDQSKWGEYIKKGHIKAVNTHRLQQRLTATTKPRKLVR